MEYYNYQQGLVFRDLNQNGRWDDHNKHCRDFIIRALDIFKPDRVTVLGSGWLLEVPLTEMSGKSDKVRLVDIIHPPEVRNQVRKLKNVELVEQDITGGLIEDIWKIAGKYRLFRKEIPLESISVPEYRPYSDPGLVISVNILTQLESLPVKLLKKHTKISNGQADILRSAIQKKHIQFLSKHRFVLISDYEEIITGKSGNVTSETTLLTDLPDYSIREEWIWNFDQTGTDFYNRKSKCKVVALISRLNG